jgi:copper(I)-binding protein
MKGLRLLIALVCFSIAGAAFYFQGDGVPKITLSGAVLQPMGPGHALTLTIDNPGWSERLIEVSTDDTGPAMLTSGAPVLGIPAESTPSFAMDGVHAMVMGLGDMEDGRLVPVRLAFERGGEITTRARVSTAMMMDHSAPFDVPADEPAPKLRVTVTPHGSGWNVLAEVQDFTFSKSAVDGPHQPGIGHAHLYLNGLKLQRMYGPEARIGALPPGAYEVRVTINTNDHLVYSVDGLPVTAAAEITVD